MRKRKAFVVRKADLTRFDRRCVSTPFQLSLSIIYILENLEIIQDKVIKMKFSIDPKH